MWVKLLLLALAGALGALARYGLAGLIQRAGDGRFPWGTFGVNVLGCFLAGVLWAFFEDRLGVSPQIRTIVLVGFMGAFTTFSAFALETSHLMRDGQYLWALGNVLGQNVLGIAALVVGLILGRLL
jgi:fluoride exporter